MKSVEKALAQSRDRGNDKKPMKTIKKKQVSFLKKYIETIRGQLSRNQRAKIVALVTIEVIIIFIIIIISIIINSRFTHAM